jgi:hypothetical protein
MKNSRPGSVHTGLRAERQKMPSDEVKL